MSYDEGGSSWGPQEDSAGSEEMDADGPRAQEPMYDPDMVPGVQTGEDVVAFYGKYGQDSTVKFFYCVR